MTAVVVPALDEAATIGSVVEGLRAFAAAVYVVDDGSSDSTAEVAERAGARIIRNATPSGYDAAVAAGINRAFSDGATIVVTCDADGQHRAEDVACVAAAVAGGADFAAGVRDHYNRRVEALTGLVARVVFGTPDPFCGLKGYGAAMRLRVGEFPANMHVGTLPLVWVRKNALRAAFVPIAVRQRADHARFGKRFRADLKLLSAFASTLRSLAF